jgi:hypothetical protein
VLEWEYLLFVARKIRLAVITARTASLAADPIVNQSPDSALTFTATFSKG